MMKTKTKVESQEISEQDFQKLQEQNKQMEQSLRVLTDLKNLEDESYYRQQLLMNQERNLLLMERIAQAVEKNTAVLETSLSEEEETEEEPVEEETKEELKETTK